MLRNTIIFPETDSSTTRVCFWPEQGIHVWGFPEGLDQPTVSYANPHGPRAKVPRNVFDQIARIDQPQSVAELDYYIGQRTKSRSRMAKVCALEACEAWPYLNLPGSTDVTLGSRLGNMLPSGAPDEAYELLLERRPILNTHAHRKMDALRKPNDVLPDDTPVLPEIEEALRSLARELASEVAESLNNV